VARRVAVTGAAGQLGRELVRAFGEAGDEVLALARPGFDLTDPSHLARLVAWRPTVVVNAAAWTDVDACARDPDRAMLINGEAAGAVARAVAALDAVAVQVSTNEVFDGSADRAYVEDDPPNPINPYAASKLAGERQVAAAGGRYLIVRTAWVFGPQTGFPQRIRAAADRMLDEGRPLRVVADEWGNPTPAAWLAGAIARLVALDEAGGAAERVYHAAGQPAVSRHDWARHSLAGHPVEIEPIALRDYPRDSIVPPRAVLDTRRLERLGLVPGDWRAVSSR
jgi:dTDP-4-dehydrorhamnose reductase